MSKFYKLLMLMLVALVTGGSAQAAYRNYYMAFLADNDKYVELGFENSQGAYTKYEDFGADTDDPWYEAGDRFGIDSTDGGEIAVISIKAGYQAEVKILGSDKSLVATISPEATPRDGFAQTFKVSMVTYGDNANSGTNVNNRKEINVAVTAATGGEDPGTGDDPVDENAFPAEGYGFDVRWDNAGAIKISAGYSVLTLDPGTVYYRNWDYTSDSPYMAKPTLKIEPNEGYKITKVYSIDKEGETATVNKGYGNYYQLAISNYDRKTIYFETEKEGFDSKFTVSFVNTPESFDRIDLTGSNRELKATFAKGEAKEFEFNKADDTTANFHFNAQTWEDYIDQIPVYDNDGNFTYDENGDQIFKYEASKNYKKIYKLFKNETDITESALQYNTGTPYYSVSIADGDKFSVQPFELDPERPSYTVTVNAPEGLINKIQNNMLYTEIKPDENNTFSVLQGTKVRIYFNDDWNVTAISYAGTDYDAEKNEFDNSSFLFTPTADGELKIVASKATYTDVTYTLYVTCAEGIIVHENNGEGRVLDLGEGEAVSADIALPSISSAGAAACTMEAAKTRKYTVTVSSKYGRILVETKDGYWMRGLRSGTVSNKDNANAKSITATTAWICAEKVENDSKALIYFAGTPGDVAIRAARTNEANITHAITATGYTEFEFDNDYETPFDIAGINISDGGTYVGGKESANVNVYVDNVIQAVDENGVFTAVPIKNGSVIKIFADGKLYRQQQIQVVKDEKANAEIKYDRTWLFDFDTEILKAHEGTEFAITPDANTTVNVDGTDLIPDADGVCSFTLPAYKATDDDYDHVIKLVYSAPAANICVVTPADGSTVEELSQITIAFPNATTVETGADVEFSDVILKKADWSYTANPEDMWLDETADCPTVIMTFPKAYQTNGKYSLLIPAGFFVADGQSVGEINADYTLNAVITDFTFEYEPFDGVIRLYDYVNFGVMFNDTRISITGIDDSKIVVKNNGTVVEGIEFMRGDNVNMFFGSIEGSKLAEGTLTMSSEAGAISFVGGTSPAIEAEWKVVALKEYTYTTTPADKAVVASLDEITLVIDNAETAAIVREGGITLNRDDYTYFETAAITEVAGAEAPTFKLTFENKATAPGEYILSVGYGTFMVDGLFDNDSFQLTYTLAADPFDKYVIEPADEAELQYINQITVSFPDAALDITVDQTKVEEILVRNLTNYNAYAYAASVEADADATVPTFIITLDQALTAGGTYSVIIPEGLFVAATYTSGDITATYTIPGKDMSWSVSSDEDIDLNAEWFDEGVMVGFMFTDESHTIEPGDPMICVMNNETELVYGEDYEVEAAYNFIQFNIKNDGTLKAGELMVFIGAGSFYVSGEPCGDMEYTWKVTGEKSGIDSVTADGADSDAIYNLLGIKMQVEWSKLPAGVYIKGGKKFLKK